MLANHRHFVPITRHAPTLSTAAARLAFDRRPSMRPNRWYPLLLMVLLPHTASAFQLRWSNGSTDLTFESATRCTLVVQADSAEVALPSEWRLQWVADSLAMQFIAMDS